MLITHEEHATTRADPELLIEEARNLQRRRRTRRLAFVAVAGVLVALMVGIEELVFGGGSPATARPPALVALGGSAPKVIYEKIELEVTTPHRPTFRHTYESWIAWTAPLTWRVRFPGSRSPQFGQAPFHDLIPELAAYQYDPRTKAIYRNGAYTLPGEPLATTPALAVRRLLSGPGDRLLERRTLAGHSVYVVSWTFRPPSSPGLPPAPAQTSSWYIDADSYVPVMLVRATSRPAAGRVIFRALAWKILPATAANLELASLMKTHAGARIVPERVAHLGGSILNTESRAPRSELQSLAALTTPLYWLELSTADLP
jgi:hypothetical protein